MSLFPPLICMFCSEKNIPYTFAKTHSVLRPALTYRKTFLSPWFSDNRHFLFKVEVLGGLTRIKQGGLTCCRRICARTSGNPGMITETSVPEIALRIPVV